MTSAYALCNEVQFKSLPFQPRKIISLHDYCSEITICPEMERFSIDITEDWLVKLTDFDEMGKLTFFL